MFYAKATNAPLYCSAMSINPSNDIDDSPFHASSSSTYIIVIFLLIHGYLHFDTQFIYECCINFQPYDPWPYLSIRPNSLTYLEHQASGVLNVIDIALTPSLIRSKDFSRMPKLSSEKVPTKLSIDFTSSVQTFNQFRQPFHQPYNIIVLLFYKASPRGTDCQICFISKRLTNIPLSVCLELV